MADADLSNLERSTFRAAADTGLWDIFLASIVAMFSIAPLLSPSLGDFWSSAVFVPLWAAVYLGIRFIHRRVAAPRIGIVRFGQRHRDRLLRFSLIMVVFNVVALALGTWAATRSPSGQAFMAVLVFPLVLLVGFSLAAALLDIPRLFAYGLLLAGAPFVGEELFRRGYVSHHGFPVVFGVAAIAILVSGLARFARCLPRRSPLTEERSPGDRLGESG